MRPLVWLLVAVCLVWPTSTRYELLPGDSVTWGIPPSGTPEGVPLAAALEVDSLSLSYHISPCANHHISCACHDCNYSHIQFLCNGVVLLDGTCNVLTTVPLTCSGNLSIYVANTHPTSSQCGQYINFLNWTIASVTGAVPAGASVAWGLPAAGSPVGVPRGSGLVGPLSAYASYHLSVCGSCTTCPTCAMLAVAVYCNGVSIGTLTCGASGNVSIACSAGPVSVVVQNTNICNYSMVFDEWSLFNVTYSLSTAQAIQWGIPAGGNPVGVPLSAGIVTARLNISYRVSVSSLSFACADGCPYSTLRLQCNGVGMLDMQCSGAETAVADLNCNSPSSMSLLFTSTVSTCDLEVYFHTWALLPVALPDFSPSPSPSQLPSPSPSLSISPSASSSGSLSPSLSPSPVSASPSPSLSPSPSGSPSGAPSRSPSPSIAAPSPSTFPSPSPSPATAPQILLSPTVGLTTREDGQTATLSVSLQPAPLADVSVVVSSLTTSEGTVSPSRLTFKASNYNTPQTVTITGVQDKVTDGTKNYLVYLVATSTDTRFQSLSANVTVANQPFPWLIGHSMSNGCDLQNLPCQGQPLPLPTLRFCNRSAVLTITGTEFAAFSSYSVAFVNGQPNTPDAIPTCTAVVLTAAGNLECSYTPNANACGLWRLQLTMGSIVVPALALYLKASQCLSSLKYFVVLTTLVEEFSEDQFISDMEGKLGLNCTDGQVWNLSPQGGSTTVTFDINGLGNAESTGVYSSLTSDCAQRNLSSIGLDCSSTQVTQNGLRLWPVSSSPTTSMSASDGFQWWWVVWPPIVGAFLILAVIALVWWLKQRRAREDAAMAAMDTEKAEFPQWASNPFLGYQNTTPIRAPAQMPAPFWPAPAAPWASAPSKPMAPPVPSTESQSFLALEKAGFYADPDPGPYPAWARGLAAAAQTNEVQDSRWKYN